MAAQVIDIHDFMPASLAPPRRTDAPCVVIILPAVKRGSFLSSFAERWRKAVTDDGLPSDCQP